MNSKEFSQSFKSIGGKGEQIAVDYLIENGYRIVHRNYVIRGGELDIVCNSLDGYLVFVEVKSFHDPVYYPPLYRVSPKKQKLLLRTAKHYLFKYHLYDSLIRFDVLLVNLSKQEVEHFYDVIHDIS